MKSFFFYVMISVLIMIYQRSQFRHDQFQYYPAEKLNEKSKDTNNYFKMGAYEKMKTTFFTQQIALKVINNYLFIVDNNIKIQITLIDLDYSKLLLVNYFSESDTFSFEQMFFFSFEVPQNVNQLNLNINKEGKSYRAKISQQQIRANDQKRIMKTSFDIFLKNNENEFTLELNHFQSEDECVYYLRNGVANYKCYNGFAEGSAKIDIRGDNQKELSREIYMRKDNSVADFDGFRASGLYWHWLWGMGSGIDSEGERTSINIGTIQGLAQDFLHIGKNIYQLTNIQFLINENSTIGQSIKFKSNSPSMEVKFKITAKVHHYKDMFILKNDMVKFQGYWSGYFINPLTKKVHKIQRFPGLIETANSIF